MRIYFQLPVLFHPFMYLSLCQLYILTNLGLKCLKIEQYSFFQFYFFLRIVLVILVLLPFHVNFSQLVYQKKKKKILLVL